MKKYIITLDMENQQIIFTFLKNKLKLPYFDETIGRIENIYELNKNKTNFDFKISLQNLINIQFVRETSELCITFLNKNSIESKRFETSPELSFVFEYFNKLWQN